MLKFILTILDGYGLREEIENNAAKLAVTPNLDRLFDEGSMVQLQTSGLAVGLPEGVMGNSEVGHMNIGAGRVVKQDLVRINLAISENTLEANPNLRAVLAHCKAGNRTLHLMGLFSDGGVHSHLDHLWYIVQAADKAGVKDIAIHAFMDGRDTPPNSGIHYMTTFQEKLKSVPAARIASIVGRYYAMDRDNRWDRVQKAYEMLTNRSGERFDDPITAMQHAYDAGITDEFVTPRIIGKGAVIRSGDGVLAFNYRADRMREISRAFTESGFKEFTVDPVDVYFTSMTRYQESFTFPGLFPPEVLTEIFPEILAKAGYRQLRIAETEKYAHVTYFFNGGDEKTFPGESRILVPSPKVATYDLQPEMSADEVTDRVIESIEGDQFEAIILNFANPDMVGHTGVLSAAIKAIESVDRNVGRIRKAVESKGAALFLTADHGNLEMMVDPETGEPHTAHTTLPVAFILLSPDPKLKLEGNGRLADIAPTILDYLDLAPSSRMDGNSLLKRRTD